jgi:hypothetical protein
MRLQRNQEIDCGFRNHLGLAIWFSKTEPTSTAAGCCLRVRSRRCGFLRGGRSFYFNPPPSVKLPFRQCVPDCSTTPTTCSAPALRPVRAVALCGGAASTSCRASLSTTLSNLFFRSGAAYFCGLVDSLFRARRSFEGARLLQLAAPLCQPLSFKADFLRPSNFAFGGRGFYIPAASFVNRDSDPDISP